MRRQCHDGNPRVGPRWAMTKRCLTVNPDKLEVRPLIVLSLLVVHRDWRRNEKKRELGRGGERLLSYRPWAPKVIGY